MKKNNVALTLCLLCATYSCDGCMDDAEIVENTKHDSRENYTICKDAYANIRKKIANCWNVTFQSGQQQSENDILKPIENALPESSKIDGNSTKDFFYVNNNIVLESFLRCCLQEKIWVELLIETICAESSDKKNLLLSSFKKCLEDGEREIIGILTKLDNESNQDIYSKNFDLNKAFNDGVLKKILPEIIKEKPDLKKYENLPTYLGVAQMLMCEIMSDELREKKFAEKWNKYYKEEN